MVDAAGHDDELRIPAVGEEGMEVGEWDGRRSPDLFGGRVEEAGLGQGPFQSI